MAVIEEPPADAPPLTTTKFYVYVCKDCKSVTTDPVNHTITSEHFAGYTAKTIPVEVEQTAEEAAAEKKGFEKTSTEVVEKAIRTQQAPPSPKPAKK